jgi:hypothetical protein
MPRSRVAIACQGGGSHTAFTAGVLLGRTKVRWFLRERRARLVDLPVVSEQHPAH